MVTKYIGFFAATALLTVSGCTDLTEFDHTLRAGVNIVSTPDLSLVHTIENISEARSLCPLPGCFIVATTEGTVIRFDSQTYEQTGSFIVGSPSSSGYFEMEYSPTESSVYVIGAFGQISELHVPDMEVLDNFSLCESPVDIEIGTDIEVAYFYVAGATSKRIFEVRLSSNIASRSCYLEFSPTCMAIDQTQDTLLIGTVGETEIVSLGTGPMRNRIMDDFPGILAIEAIPDDTVFCAVFDCSKGLIATIFNYFPPYAGSCWSGAVQIDGDIHYMCADPDGYHVYILSYLGDNVSRLISYNCWNYLIEHSTDLQGYPIDLEICSGGTLLVLTAE
ncbi:MAG: hypothetical protein K8S15_03110 [Candidatus Aegiribacteria sp.]|nr:hypothetical protein [Candidatus Aegiribacteria sp.]